MSSFSAKLVLRTAFLSLGPMAPQGGYKAFTRGYEQGLSWIRKHTSLRVYVKSGYDIDLLRGSVAFLLFVGLFLVNTRSEIKV